MFSSFLYIDSIIIIHNNSRLYHSKKEISTLVLIGHTDEETVTSVEITLSVFVPLLFTSLYRIRNWGPRHNHYISDFRIVAKKRFVWSSFYTIGSIFCNQINKDSGSYFDVVVPQFWRDSNFLTPAILSDFEFLTFPSCSL